MERITTNKPVAAMNATELAHNSCYRSNGNVRYRNHEIDIDARELVIKLLDKYADIPNEFTCNDDFDNQMEEYLKLGLDHVEGLIALFYQNLWAMADLRDHLKKCEDLEESSRSEQTETTAHCHCKIMSGDIIMNLEENEVLNVIERNFKDEVFSRVVEYLHNTDDEDIAEYFDDFKEEKVDYAELEGINGVSIRKFGMKTEGPALVITGELEVEMSLNGYNYDTGGDAPVATAECITSFDFSFTLQNGKYNKFSMEH